MIEKDLLPIRDRILRALEELPGNRGRRGHYPKADGVHNTVIKRLLDGDALPGVKNMLKICRATGLTADYFYFGEKAAITRISEPHETYFSLAPGPVDTEIIAQVVTAAEAYLEEHRLKISGPRKGKLISMLYEHVVTEREPATPEIIKAYLRLTH